MTKLIINTKPIVPDSIYFLDNDYTDEYKKQVEEANRRIETNRKKEREALINARNFIVGSNTCEISKESKSLTLKKKI